MLVGYARVSTEEQSLNRQIDALVNYGVDERNIYKEKVTGTKMNRIEMNRLIDELKPNDLVVVAELTRLSRSSKDLFEIVEKIQNHGANIKSLKESWLDTTTAQGKLMFTIFAGLSQFERDLISERTKEGLKSARSRGSKMGRPPKKNDYYNVVIELYKNNCGATEICNKLNSGGARKIISRTTVNRILKEYRTSIE
jgi:Site-specific recombinases, DNA invertase Pin homologs